MISCLSSTACLRAYIDDLSVAAVDEGVAVAVPGVVPFAVVVAGAACPAPVRRIRDYMTELSRKLCKLT